MHKYQGNFLNEEGLKELVIEKLEHMKLQKLRTLVFDIDNLRNNFAHGNSDKAIDDAREEMQELFFRYDSICNRNDPLGRFGKE